MDTFITYDGLPVRSGGAHQLGDKSPYAIYNTVINFLDYYANTSNPAELLVELPNYSIKNLFACIFRYGMPDMLLSKFFLRSQRNVCWKVKFKKISELTKDITDNSTIILSIKWKFKFVDIYSKLEIPGQNELPIIDSRLYNSQIYLRLSSIKSTISVWLALPFSDLSEYSRFYINGMQTRLPFKFSKSHWRLWKKSKNDNWYSKKLDY